MLVTLLSMSRGEYKRNEQVNLRQSESSMMTIDPNGLHLPQESRESSLMCRSVVDSNALKINDSQI